MAYKVLQGRKQGESGLVCFFTVANSKMLLFISQRLMIQILFTEPPNNVIGTIYSNFQTFIPVRSLFFIHIQGIVIFSQHFTVCKSAISAV